MEKEFILQLSQGKCLCLKSTVINFLLIEVILKAVFYHWNYAVLYYWNYVLLARKTDYLTDFNKQCPTKDSILSDFGANSLCNLLDHAIESLKIVIHICSISKWTSTDTKEIYYCLELLYRLLFLLENVEYHITIPPKYYETLFEWGPACDSVDTNKL